MPREYNPEEIRARGPAQYAGSSTSTSRITAALAPRANTEPQLPKGSAFHLLALPVEILRLILESSWHSDGFESLMLSCRTLYANGTGFIARHNHHKQHFHSIEIRAPHDDTGYLLDSLEAYVLGIAAHSEIGQYAHTLTIAQDGERKYMNLNEVGDKRDAPRYTNSGLEWVRARDEERTKEARTRLMLEAVVDSPWFKAAGVDTTAWIARIPQFQKLVEVVESDSDSDDSLGNDSFFDEPELTEAEAEVAVTQLVVLLLSQLPKLETLIFRRKVDLSADPSIGSDEVRDSQRVLELMVARIEDDRFQREKTSVDTDSTDASVIRLRACSHLTSPLQNLREVRTDIEKIAEVSMATRCLDAIFASPRVRDVFATCLIADEDGFRGEFHGPSPSSDLLKSVQPYSGVERLELYGCAISPAGIAGLVHRMPFLKALRIMHDHKSDGTWGPEIAGAEWDLDGFLKAVAGARPMVPLGAGEGDESGKRTVGENITDLSVSLAFEYYPYNTAIWSLQNFTSLKRLELGAWVFIGPNPASGERLGDLKPSPPRPGFEKWDRDKDGHIPKLIDVLPPSIEEVYMYIEGKYDVWRRLFEGFGANRAERLPLLQRFVVWDELESYDYGVETLESYTEREDAAIEELKSHGIEHLGEFEAPHQPFWLTDFENRAIEDPLSH